MTLPWETFFKSPFGWWITTIEDPTGTRLESQPAKNAPEGGGLFSRRKSESAAGLLKMKAAPSMSCENAGVVVAPQVTASKNQSVLSEFASVCICAAVLWGSDSLSKQWLAL